LTLLINLVTSSPKALLVLVFPSVICDQSSWDGNSVAFAQEGVYQCSILVRR
jgi:hypothetical protein